MGGAMAAEKLNRFLAILGEEERMAGRFERVLHKLAGDGGIVNDQDLAAWQRLLHEFPMPLKSSQVDFAYISKQERGTRSGKVCT